MIETATDFFHLGFLVADSCRWSLIKGIPIQKSIDFVDRRMAGVRGHIEPSYPQLFTEEKWSIGGEGILHSRLSRLNLVTSDLKRKKQARRMFVIYLNINRLDAIVIPPKAILLKFKLLKKF